MYEMDNGTFECFVTRKYTVIIKDHIFHQKKTLQNY